MKELILSITTSTLPIIILKLHQKIKPQTQNNSYIFLKYTQTLKISRIPFIEVYGLFSKNINYIIPIPPAPAGIAGSSDLILATTDSVVNKVDATLVAF